MCIRDSFHTAQSEAENNIHRAVEWSIARSYDDLRGIELGEPPEMRVQAGPHWLVELVCRGAEMANRHYEKLIAHYDILSLIHISEPTRLLSISYADFC